MNICIHLLNDMLLAVLLAFFLFCFLLLVKRYLALRLVYIGVDGHNIWVTSKIMITKDTKRRGLQI